MSVKTSKEKYVGISDLVQDPSGAPVSREKEAGVPISKLPSCNNQPNSYLACLRAVKKQPATEQMPFSPLESKLNSALNDVHLAALSPKVNPMSPNYIRELRA